MPYRAAVTLAATAAALMLLVSFRTPPSVSLFPAVAAPTPSASAATPAPSATPSGAPPSGGGSPTPAATPTPTATPNSSGLKNGTFTGSSVSNPFGSVQVQLVVSGGKITDVKALHYPTAHAQSAYISSIVVPELRTEVLQAQSARINLISGATYTSEGYAQSVQSALDLAHA